ncbi:MAG: hypothetical protein LBV67_04535 [Streptococcaceae bacterium]|nr:hypothetical protein [Streptococcaceae bacterium]
MQETRIGKAKKRKEARKKATRLKLIALGQLMLTALLEASIAWILSKLFA